MYVFYMYSLLNKTLFTPVAFAIWKTTICCCVFDSLIGSSSVLLQSNLNSSNTDGSFTMANSNSFLNSYEILPIAQEINI